MTNEEAIKQLNAWAMRGDTVPVVAIHMAIEALSATKPIVKNYDLISRADVLDIITFKRKLANIDGRILLDEIEDRINALPSTDIPTKLIAKINIDADEVVRKIKDEYEIADRPSGEWVKLWFKDDMWYCTSCGSPIMTDDITENNYCPNCGAKMGSDNK